MVDANGCPMDSDGDGVPDYLDKCPGTPKAAWGMVDDAGCPFDSDGDGVPDYIDECPNTPEAARGKVDAKGCELDTDADGVPDYKDECPTVPGLKENKGCPEVKREVRQLLQKAMQGIEFETGKATIKKKSYPLLNQIAKIFIENKNYIIEVQGHTDNVGKVDFNLELSDKRANSVRDYLIAQGVDFQRLTAVGYGMSKPIADNKTKAGRQKNRRVEFKITFEEVHLESYMDRADPQPSDNTQVTATPVEK
jgi:outer membrane protein OmpA-like peptidoglycan-associated protein